MESSRLLQIAVRIASGPMMPPVQTEYESVKDAVNHIVDQMIECERTILRVRINIRELHLRRHLMKYSEWISWIENLVASLKDARRRHQKCETLLEKIKLNPENGLLWKVPDIY